MQIHRLVGIVLILGQLLLMPFGLAQSPMISVANDSKQNNPLTAAVTSSSHPTTEEEQHSLGVLTLFLSQGANAKTKDGNEALNRAAHQGWKDVVSILLEHGANIEYQGGYDGSTALIQAARIFAHGVYASITREKESLETVSYLLAQGANVNAQNKEGQTPLIKAPYNIAVLLLNHGADIEIRDNAGASALTWAVSKRMSKKLHFYWKKAQKLTL